jgi:ABC-type branched-subunit amino acid transport system ATPase component/branched-subunit amino acid ABC-type transport system permease component
MSLLPYLIAGVVTGSVYALAATGLVLTYRTSGVFNFGHGALATVAAYVFYTLNVQRGLPWGVAAAVSVVVLGPLLGLVLELLARTLTGVSLVHSVTATVGVVLVVNAAIGLTYDQSTNAIVPQFLPESTWHVGKTPITAGQVVVIGFALLATIALSIFLRRARAGVAMRGVVDNPALLSLAGTSPTSVRRIAWCIGSSFACASGVLLSPLLAKLDPIALTFLVVTAFGAAAVGAFGSIPLAYAGAIGIGVAQALWQKWFVDGVWSGLSAAMPFLVLFGVLLFMPKRRLLQRVATMPRPRRVLPTPPLALQLGAAAVLLAGVLIVPQIGSLDLLSWTTGLTYVMVFSSLGLLIRSSGQVSLAHVTFMAIGVCAMSWLAAPERGIPWGLALLLSGLVAVPIGALLAIPAIRLSGLYLALATFGFGILVQYMFYSENFMFGSFGNGLVIPRPNVEALATDKGFYYLVAGLTVAASALAILISRSRMGRLLAGLTQSPTALATAGASANITRVLVFCISAFIAAVAGALGGASSLVVTSDAYQPILSLILFITVVVSFGREPWYAMIAAFVVFIVPSLPGASPNAKNLISLTIGALALFIGFRPKIADLLTGLVPARLIRAQLPIAAAVAATDQPESTSTASTAAAGSASGLAVTDLRVQFGGLVAVDGIHVEAPLGRITGLIGPNGAGKTTTFNACSGLTRPTAGRIHLDEHDISRVSPSGRARRGIGRTFQQMELFDSMTVRANVELGAEAGMAGLNPISHLIATPAQARRVRASAREALALCGIADLAQLPVATLSTGQRRLVELARCLAGPYHLLLLDEPSSGLDAAETQHFGAILRRVVQTRGVGILIVEHDMKLVSAICDYLYVLDFGRPIFDGPTADTLSAPIVRSAYLGDHGVDEIARIDDGQAAAAKHRAAETMEMVS